MKPTQATGEPERLLTWDERILAVLPPGVDETQLDENLKLTPTERIEKLERFLADITELRAGLPR